MAKLSDRELLEKFRDAPHVFEDDVLDRMPERIGKVDVAGIAREIEDKFVHSEITPAREVERFHQQAVAILRSHLEGKSE